MYFYYFRAVKKYKDMFQFMRAIKIKRFNSHLYFYYIDNGIDFLIVAVNLNKMPFIVTERQLYRVA